MKKFLFQVAVKSVATETKDGKKLVRIEGYASTPDLDRYQDIVEPEAFKDALELFMKNPVLLRSHDMDRPVGSITSATVTEKGLKVTADVMDEQTSAEIEDGRMRAFSIGYIPLVTELSIKNEDGSLRPFNWESDSIWAANVVRVIKKVDLVEISIVSTPANGNALFTLEKSLAAAMKEVSVKSFMPANSKTTETPPEASAKAPTPAQEEKQADAAKAARGPETGAGGDGAGEAPAEGSEAKKAGDEGATAPPADDKNPDEEGTPHVVTDEDLKANPGLAEAGVKVGDTILLPKEAPAAEEPEKETEPSDEGEEPEEGAEDAENGGATPPADGGEGAAKAAAEAPKADAKPQTETGDKPEEGAAEKRVAVPRNAYEKLKVLAPMAKRMGLLVAEDDPGKGDAVNLPDEVKALMDDLTTLLVDTATALAEATAKLAETPEKRALALQGQFEQPAKAEEKGARTEPSSAFKRLFPQVFGQG